MKFLFLLALLFAGQVPAASLCSDLISNRFTSADLYWRSEMERSYLEARDVLYDPSRYQSIYSEERYIAARMATRFLEGENHAVLAHKYLGYELHTDEAGLPIMKSPRSIFTFIRNFEAWKKVAKLSPEENLELVFVFVKKELTVAPKNLEDYVLVKASEIDTPGKWPDPAVYKSILNEQKLSTLPSKVFVAFLGQGFVQVPTGPFLDHDTAHLTELMSQSGHGTDSFLKELKSYGQRRLKNWKRQSPKKSFREIFSLELSTLPDRNKIPEIRDFSRRWGIDPKASVAEAKSALANQLVNLSNERVIESVETFRKEVSPLIYRQGGETRDNTGSYSAQRITHHTDILMENGLPFPKEEFESISPTDALRRDHLLTYLNIDMADEIAVLKNPQELAAIVFRMQHHWTPKMTVTEEEFRKMIVTFLASRMARVAVALNVGLELELTPTQALRDALAPRFNTKSKLGRYLDAYLPSVSPIRRVFNLDKDSNTAAED